jgi:hypothetical protein
MLDLRGWMKNSGKEMSVNLAVCDEEVGARLRSLSVLDVIVHLHTPIYGVSLYQYKSIIASLTSQSSYKAPPSFSTNHIAALTLKPTLLSTFIRSSCVVI